MGDVILNKQFTTAWSRRAGSSMFLPFKEPLEMRDTSVEVESSRVSGCLCSYL